MTPPGSPAPSPPGWPLAGHAPAFRRDPLGFLRSAANSGPVVRLRLGPFVYHLVTDPALVREVLQARAANYARDGRSARQMRLVTGESLLSTEGDTWRRHRRLAQPVFHSQRLAGLAATTVAACTETIDRWSDAARKGRTLDLVAELSRLTFTIAGRSLFGADLGPHAGAVEQAYPVLVDELFRRSRALAALPAWVPTPGHRRFHRALAAIDAIVAELIAGRRRAPAGRDDLLDALLQARDEDGSALSDAEIRNHAVTFLLAGHETTASTLVWTLALLDQNRPELDPVEAELDTVLAGRIPTLADLPRLTRLDAALQESLRLFPAIWLAERRVLETDTLGGCTIPGDSGLVVSAYVTQRLAAHWPDPDTFRPARFSGRTPPGLAEGFLPFGAGPHQCIGQHFALLEARLALATLLSRFRIHLAGEFPAPLAGITLRPAATVPVRIELR
ncbi:MAG: cytochrome P450 [Opitutaceae bacterium]|nr:cytochrome P450 [Opitutaceae bacterium]